VRRRSTRSPNETRRSNRNRINYALKRSWLKMWKRPTWMGVSAKRVSLPVSNLSIATSARSVFEVYLCKSSLATGFGHAGV